MARPLRDTKIDQLEALAATASTTVELEVIEQELAVRRHRTRNRQLARLIGARLKELEFKGPVFRDPEMDRTDDDRVSYFEDYLPKAQHFRRGGDNQDYPEESRRILQLKQGEIVPLAIFSARLSALVCARLVFVAVPSSDPSKTTGGVVLLARAAAQLANGVDGTAALVRTVKRPPAHAGGDRSIEGHLATLQVVDSSLIAGRSVLVVDDVATTGNSLRACRRLLLQAGAHRVKLFAIAHTMR